MFGLVLLVLMAFLFIPAGTLNWPQGWLLIIIYFSWIILVVNWLKKNNPSLLEKRLSTKAPTKGWDRIFVYGTGFLFAIFFIMFGLDAVRYEWSRIPLFLEIVGFAGIVVSLMVIFLTMKENPFLARTVEIQKGHKVITTGPYKYVRHPMYSAFISMILFLSLALGSLYSLIPGVLIDIFIIGRTYLEDKTLFEELEGYKEYVHKTPYRLIPGIW